MYAFGTEIGIDSETTGGTHVFDPLATAILQICTHDQVYIFDCLELDNHPLFQKVMTEILTNCVIYGQSHLKEVNHLAEELHLPISDRVK